MYFSAEIDPGIENWLSHILNSSRLQKRVKIARTDEDRTCTRCTFSTRGMITDSNLTRSAERSALFLKMLTLRLNLIF